MSDQNAVNYDNWDVVQATVIDQRFKVIQDKPVLMLTCIPKAKATNSRDPNSALRPLPEDTPAVECSIWVDPNGGKSSDDGVKFYMRDLFSLGLSKEDADPLRFDPDLRSDTGKRFIDLVTPKTSVFLQCKVRENSKYRYGWFLYHKRGTHSAEDKQALKNFFALNLETIKSDAESASVPAEAPAF